MNNSNEKSKECCEKCYYKPYRKECKCPCHKPSVEVSKCCGGQIRKTELVCGTCLMTCEPQSIPLDRENMKKWEENTLPVKVFGECCMGGCGNINCKHCSTPNLTPESTEVEECHCCRTSYYHQPDSCYKNHSVNRCWTDIPESTKMEE